MMFSTTSGHRISTATAAGVLRITIPSREARAG